MKELIEELRKMPLFPSVFRRAADALERLTRSDVGLPEPDVVNKYPTPGHYTEAKLLDYGNRRAAAAVLADEALMRECLIELEDLSYSVKYAHEDDEIGRKVCCGELSYKDHSSDCSTQAAVQKLKARLGEK
jgi:hypothetical protein